MARSSRDNDIELAQSSSSSRQGLEPESLTYYAPRRDRLREGRPGPDHPPNASAQIPTASSSIEPEEPDIKQHHPFASASSLPSPSPTVHHARTPWPRRLLRFLAGPRTGPEPLPVASPLLTLSYTFWHRRGAWKPDQALTKLWTHRLRRWGSRNQYKKGLMLGLWLAGWIIAFAFLVRANSFQSRTEPSVGGEVQQLGCTSTFWGARDTCGLDGTQVSLLTTRRRGELTGRASSPKSPLGGFASRCQCQATGSIAFRCPAGCASQIVYNPRAVGASLPDRVPLVIGGGGSSPPVYRAESVLPSKLPTLPFLSLAD